MQKLSHDQKTFNIAARHLLRQNKKALKVIRGERTCLYRGPNGLRCPVGALIPNKLYRPDMECQGVYDLLIRNTLTLLGHTNLDLCSDLQCIHDEYHPNQWRNKLKHIADKYDLEMPALR